MKTILFNAIKEVIIISDKEVEVLTSAFHIITKKKNEYLVEEGALSQNLYFIINGYVRCFYIDNCNEITTQILSTKDFVTSFESFLNKENSKESIQCISDCTLLSVSKTDYENLYKNVSNWSYFCKSVYEKYIIKISERANSLQNLSALDRYLRLLKTQPNIALNTAVKHLASYLGIKPQSLSRIRKEVIK